MSSLKVTLCAGVAVIAAVLVPTAYATGEDGDGGRSVSVTPSTPAAGAEVVLRVTGCAGKTATAASEAFVSDARLVGTGGTLVGGTRVRSSTRAGAYDVRIICADFQVKGRIQVVAGSSAPDGPTSVPASPIAPVHAGGGGTARLAAAERSDAGEDGEEGGGPGTAQAVTGLVLAGVAATVVAFRGLRRSRRAG